MSMHKNMMDILNVLYFDETLLRLLYYPAKNLKDNTPDPLDISLPNILDTDVDWSIRNSRIKSIPKVDDLTDTPICRLLIYAGRRSSDGQSYLTANQQLIIDVVCHESFEDGDLRTAKISDRLNELFVAEKITGIGKMYFVEGGQITGLPSEYVGFKNVYRYGSVAK
jgi:hypothetical protein